MSFTQLHKSLKYLAGAVCIISSPFSFAGGPDTSSMVVNPLHGFEFGIEGLFGLGITNNENTFTASNTTGGLPPTTITYSASNNSLATDAVGGGGLVIGYNIPLNTTIAIEPVFNVNWLAGTVTSQWNLPGLSQLNSARTVQNAFAPKIQYNFLVRLKTLAASHFAFLFDVGVSDLTFNNTFTISTTASNSTPPATPVVKENNLNQVGPVLGLGGEWLIGHYSAISLIFDNYLYFSSTLATQNNLDPTNYNEFSVLSSRKVSFFLPSITAEYSVHFNA